MPVLVNMRFEDNEKAYPREIEAFMDNQKNVNELWNVFQEYQKDRENLDMFPDMVEENDRTIARYVKEGWPEVQITREV
jgi:hypothetical protein